MSDFACGPAVSRIFRICNSYESGFGHGLQNDGLDISKTPHADAELGEAYQIGYEAGATMMPDPIQIGKYLLKTDGAGMFWITDENGHEEQFAARVVELLIADFFERNRKKTYKPAPPDYVEYDDDFPQKGCQLPPTLYFGEKADECVFDVGPIGACAHALDLYSEGKGRNDCPYWKPVK